MAVYLIANPAAGDGSRGAEFWQQRLSAAGVAVDRILSLDGPWPDALGPEDQVLVAGGDGSVSAAAAVCAQYDCLLGILPAGTANDFARSLGLPLEPAAACRVAAGGRQRRVDLGWLNERHFLNVAHVGLGADVSRGLPGSHKRRWRRLVYLRGLVDRLRARRGFRARLTCGGSEAQGRWLTIAIANGERFGGGQAIPAGRLDDGLLDVFGVRPRSLTRLFLAWLAMLLAGRKPHPRDVVHLRGTACRVQTRHPHAVSADGEPRGQTPIQARVRPGALRVIVPGT